MKNATWLSGVFNPHKLHASPAADAPAEKLVESEDPAQLMTGSKSLLTLPMEIFVKILEYTALGQSPSGITRDLYSLSCTCKQLDSVLQDLRNRHAQILTRTQARAFYKYYSKNAAAARRVRSVTFVHPVNYFDAYLASLPIDSPERLAPIQDSWVEQSWGFYILKIIQILPRIECVELREMSPKFYFDDFEIRAATSKNKSRSLSVPNLIINPERSDPGGRLIPIRLYPSLLSPFTSIGNLYLLRMIVDNLQDNFLLTLPVINLYLSHCMLKVTFSPFVSKHSVVSERRWYGTIIPLVSKLQSISMDASTLASTELELDRFDRPLLSVPSIVVGMSYLSQFSDESTLSQIMLSIFGPFELVNDFIFSADPARDGESLRLYSPAKVDSPLSFEKPERLGKLFHQFDYLSAKEITIVLPADDPDAIGLIDKYVRTSVTADVKVVTPSARRKQFNFAV